jgi:type I restriction enzyme S subunit
MRDGWPNVRLGEVLTLSPEPQDVVADAEYPNVGMYSYARGLFLKRPIAGSATSAKVLFRVKKDQFIYSRLFAFEGAYGVVPAEFDGAFVSNEYPTFDVDRSRLLPKFLELYFKQPTVWEAVAKASTGVGHRRQRVPPSGVLSTTIPLPELSVQQRAVSRVESIAGRIEEARTLADGVDRELSRLLATVRTSFSERAPRRRLGDVAPLLRRPVAVDIAETYQQVAVRSFGRGSFHKEPLVGADVTWEKPFRVAKDDILISNIKAWEGAIAVASSDDDGRVASHRYLTLVPHANVATGKFLVAYLLSPDGLFQIGEASPGSADRNRTLSAKKLMEIEVPVPTYSNQKQFDSLVDHVAQVRSERNAALSLTAGLMPTLLDKAFRGEM